MLILIGVVILAAIWMKYHFHLKELERRLDATVKNISKLDSTDAARAIREMDIDGSTYRSRMIGYRRTGIIWAGIGVSWLLVRTLVSIFGSVDLEALQMSYEEPSLIMPWLAPCILIVVGIAKLVAYRMTKKLYYDELAKEDSGKNPIQEK